MIRRFSPTSPLLITALLLQAGCGDGPQPRSDSQPVSDASADGSSDAAEPETAKSVSFTAPALTAEELDDGWISLFDGASLFGWTPSEGTNWHVEEGTIVADSGPPGLLRTPFHFDDFELRCEFHLAAGGNSGVFVYAAASVATG